MRPSLNQSELESWVDFLESHFVQAQLQSLIHTEKFFIFQFYKRKPMNLICYLDVKKPFLLYSDKKYNWGNKKQSPVYQYLQSHFNNSSIKEFKVKKEEGRVVTLILSKGVIEFVLVPEFFNIKIIHNNKTIYLNKPKEIPKRDDLNLEQMLQDSDFSNQKNEDLLNQLFMSPPLSSKKKQSWEDLIKKTEKKISLIGQDKLEKEKQLDQESSLVNQMLVGQESDFILSSWYKKNLSLYQNRDLLYLSIKSLKNKILKTEEKLKSLNLELKKFKDYQSTGLPVVDLSSSLGSQKLKSAQARGRAHRIGKFSLALGKSGVDNLALLRQAKSWDYWFHIKQGAGPHLFLYRNKGEIVDDSLLKEAAHYLLEQSVFKSNGSGYYEVVCAEVKFVKPIRGEIPGLVRYSHEKTFSFRL